ncbi:hypothetical protein Xcc3_04680 [Xanthomonas campestris pv. campestris]|nr:hypothetical protein Xcc1_04710 [Xanthomonas campestris pv. campestris]BBJ99160.1 hypothetical protein Xcc3_04680 [Xanthomonas campestris pv. campestris]
MDAAGGAEEPECKGYMPIPCSGRARLAAVQSFLIAALSSTPAGHAMQLMKRKLLISCIAADAVAMQLAMNPMGPT